MRNILVASLCVLGTFLLTYQGCDKLDSRITNVCGAATIGVALFPTSNPGFKPTWVGHVHPVVAGIALAGQALMALQFTQSAPRDGAARWLDDVKRMLRALVFRYAQRVRSAAPVTRSTAPSPGRRHMCRNVPGLTASYTAPQVRAI